VPHGWKAGMSRIGPTAVPWIEKAAKEEGSRKIAQIGAGGSKLDRKLYRKHRISRLAFESNLALVV